MEGSISVIDFNDNSDLSKYSVFYNALKESDKDLCVYKGKQSHSLLEMLDENFFNNYHKKVYYISDVREEDGKHVIKAFAFLNMKPRIRIMNTYYEGLSIELELRCSAQKGLGEILLNYIYSEYVDGQKYMLKRVPANEILKKLYALWKLPTIPECITGNSFLYTNNIEDIFEFIRSTVSTENIDYSIAKCLGLFANEIVSSDNIGLKYRLYNETVLDDVHTDFLPENHKQFIKAIIKIWYQKQQESQSPLQLHSSPESIKETGGTNTKRVKHRTNKKYRKSTRSKRKIYRRRNTRRISKYV